MSENESMQGNINQKFCVDCGNGISVNAEICPQCGVRQIPEPTGSFNKIILVLLTFFLGGLGAHKLYLRKYVQAVLYLLFSWTGIPAFIALVEFIIYLVTDERTLAQKYGTPSTTALIVAIVVPFVGIILIGIMAAIAIPQFAAYSEKANNSAAQSDVRNCSTGAEVFFADYQQYPQNLDGEFADYCRPSENVTVFYIPISAMDYQLVSYHNNGTKAYLKRGSQTEMGTISKLEAEAELLSRDVVQQKGNLVLVY